MNLHAYLRSLAAKLFLRLETATDLDEELRSHIAHRADDLERSGLSRIDAERRARVEFGSREHYREESYAALGGNFFETFAQDLRFALRMLRKSRGFTFAAIVTLALAIGANAVVFGMLDALVLRPLHVPQPETLWGTLYGQEPVFQSYPNYVDLRDRNHSFEDLAAFNFAFVGFDTGNNPAAASGFAVSGNYFDVFKIEPYLGRFFHSSDEHGLNSAPYLVLSYAYWHSHFQDDRGVVGRKVLINKHSFTILGVAPLAFRGSLSFVSPDFFMPLVNQEQIAADFTMTDRANQRSVFEVFGHIRSGITPQQATADVNAVSHALQKAYPNQVADKPSELGREGLTSFRGAVHAFVGGLVLLAGLILLAACANLGSLFAAHAADRSREVALRLALGSTRKRILRQLLTEAVVISLAGGALGLWGSVILLEKLSDWQPFASAPIHIPVTLDVRIYIVALVLALVSGLLFGIVPVRQVLRTNPYELVKAGMGGTVSGVGRRVTLRDVLLVIQIAICAVLVTSSLVAVRGLMRSLSGNYGFDPNNTIVLNTDLSDGGYKGSEIPAMHRRMIDAMGTIPGVEHVGMVNNYPPLVDAAVFRVDIYKDETRDLSQPNVAASPYHYEISPGYFAAAKTALLAGRDFTWNDDKDAPPVAVVNRGFGQKIFGSVANSIGRFFRMKDGSRVKIVGVVEDGKYLSLTENQESAVFLPILRSPQGQASLILYSHRNPQELIPAMRAKLNELDRGLPADISPWKTLLDVVLFPARIATVALGILGAMGAILSSVGIFGMAAYSVSKRLRELGIRVALGAKRGEVLGTALGRAVKLLSIGSATGLILGLLATRVLASIVYQATPRDPLVLAAAVLAMALLGLLATWIPAQRVLSVDPMILLREE